MTRDWQTNTPDQAAKADRAAAWDDRERDVPCQKCDGRGELYHGVYQNEWGVWDYEYANPCGICNATGELTAALAAEYRAYLQEQNDD